MPEPIRSPKQSKFIAKTRGNPYPRPQSQRLRQDPTTVESITQQSSSLLGAIKSLVTAPLSWLSTAEHRTEDSELVQKRKDPFFERSGTPPKSKRVRRDSPSAKDEGLAYRKLITPLWDVGNGVSPARHQYDGFQGDQIHCAPSSPVLRDHTSQSVEPLDSKLNNFRVCRSTTRERSMPPPSPFARSFSRVSLTPQPSGATFGPSPKRKQRDLTAPPASSRPLVPPVPVFTRPPSVPPSLLFPKTPLRQLSEGPIMSLLTQSRQSLSPHRETSSMLTASDAIPSVSPSKVERTLSTLETFRTPLACFPSQHYPQDRRPRKVHVPLPSKQSPFEEVRKKKVLPVAPYPTETSGLRKLLQRSKPENDAQETSGKELSVGGVRFPGISEEKIETDTDAISGVVPVGVESSTRSRKSDSYSSLRAPALNLRRTHITAPQIKKPRNKFSLKEDDADEISLSVTDLKAYESKMPKPHLSFARRMSEAGMQTEILDSPNVLPVTTSLSVLAKPGSSIEPLSKASLPIISNPHNQENSHENLSAVQLVVKRDVDLTSTRDVSRDLPSDSPLENTGSRPLSITSVDFVSSTLFGSANPNTVKPFVEPPSGPGGIPSFFSSAKTDFIPPPLPTNSIFTTVPSIFRTAVDMGNPLEKLSSIESDDVPSSSKPQAISDQLVLSNSVKLDGSSMKDTKELSRSAEQKPPTTTPSFSSSAVDTEKPTITDAGATATAVEATDAVTPNFLSTPFVFDSNAARKPTSLSLATTPVVSPFTFGSPLNPSAVNTEFTFGKIPAQTIPKPVNIFNFGSAPSSTHADGSPAQTSLPLVTENASLDLTGSINTETDTQMDTNDQMEESPRRVQDKKDAAGSPFSNASSFNVGIPTSESSFSFGISKPSTTPFAFGGANSGATSHSNSSNLGVLSFGNSKAASVGSSFGFTTANSVMEGSNFNPFPKPPDSPSSNPFVGTTLTTSTSAPIFTFGTSSFGPPKVEKPVPNGNSAPNSPSLFPQQNMSPSPSFSFSFPASPTVLAKSDIVNPPSSTSQPFQFGASSSPSSQQSGPIFTLGAATSTTPRKLKNLPQRRRK